MGSLKCTCISLAKLRQSLIGWSVARRGEHLLLGSKVVFGNGKDLPSCW